MKEPEDLFNGASHDRRSFLSLLGSLGLVSSNATMAALACTSGSAASAPAGETSTADVGSIYPEIKLLADRCQYPMSILQRAYPDFDAYRNAARQRVFELLHYDPPKVAPAAEVIGRWETADYVQEKVVFSTVPWFRVPAYVLIPKGGSGPRPGIVDLHSHGGMFL